MKSWFAAKRYGYGSGLPIAWQGWVTLAAYIGGVLGGALLLHGAVRVVEIVLMTAAFVAICAVTTEGGWRWRWGPDR